MPPPVRVTPGSVVSTMKAAGRRPLWRSVSMASCRCAAYFSAALDSIGSLYFTKEVFDGTYPGYGSSYPDLQGGLGLLFEQASSRGHVQRTAYGEITFAFTIRNQLVSTMATVKAAVENKEYLRRYQKDFFTSALRNAAASRTRAYRLRGASDKVRMKALLDKLLIHQEF